jgi:CheY-like chemotaxis protein
MTSVLEQHEVQVVPAESGREALERLHDTPGIELILMDIMMPDMDGYATMRAVRQMPAYGNLPIVAVTAKAMKSDREKCLDAGAWDYLSKPVDSAQLLAVCRAWLHR